MAQQITKTQIQKIHIAKAQLGLSRQNYEDILSGFLRPNGEPAASCKHLNYRQAEVLLNRFREMGWIEKRGQKPLKFEEYRNRDPKFASPKQMRMLEAMWMDKAREKNEIAFTKFILRITKKNHIEFLLKTDVEKIKLAIEKLCSTKKNIT